ncbi:MAG: hypothetical protein ACFB21_12310 [Opitutales bacterium]
MLAVVVNHQDAFGHWQEQKEFDQLPMLLGYNYVVPGKHLQWQMPEPVSLTWVAVFAGQHIGMVDQRAVSKGF